METVYCILALYMGISLFAIIFGGVPLFLEIEEDENWGLKLIFIFQYILYKHLKDKLNIAGIVTLEIIVSLLVFGANIMIFTGLALVIIVIIFWKFFCWIFKKRN